MLRTFEWPTSARVMSAFNEVRIDGDLTVIDCY